MLTLSVVTPGLLFDEFASTLLVAIHSDDWGGSSNFHGRAEIFPGQNSALDMLAAAASASATQRRADFIPKILDLRNRQEETLTFLFRQ